ncbi:hypothetical protein BJ170DRAFT_683703 [Xylariales sp. AK1849]|nr:hypothetical protein BJ170DRAFT_683703 [Xylariales sp. AK1849]
MENSQFLHGMSFLYDSDFVSLRSIQSFRQVSDGSSGSGQSGTYMSSQQGSMPYMTNFNPSTFGNAQAGYGSMMTPNYDEFLSHEPEPMVHSLHPPGPSGGSARYPAQNWLDQIYPPTGHSASHLTGAHTPLLPAPPQAGELSRVGTWGSARTSSTSSNEGNNWCHTCNRGYSRSQDLRRHKQTSLKHANSKGFQCGWGGCKRRFTRPDNLKRHQQEDHKDLRETATIDSGR